MGKGPQVSQDSINALQGLETNQSGLAGVYANRALPGLQSAVDYYQKLLTNPQTAQQAVAPEIQNISQLYSGAKNQITGTLPQGGERNLALAQLPIQRAGQIAQLYQGVQPAAAGALGQLSLGVGGLGNSAAFPAAYAGGSLANLAGQQALAKGQSLGGLGAGIGTAAGGYLGNKGLGGSKGQGQASS